jgi:large subunit ribosomal protein L31
MKENIHPNYREVLFVDLSNGFKFVTRSCVATAAAPERTMP